LADRIAKALFSTRQTTAAFVVEKIPTRIRVVKRVESALHLPIIKSMQIERVNVKCGEGHLNKCDL
jgi:hypothetical protein